MELLINWSRYCNVLSLPSNLEMPEDFKVKQYSALDYIYKNMSQTHLFPVTYKMYMKLKPTYKRQFDMALCEQIKYMINNRSIFDDPASVVVSSSIGNYSHGPMGDGTLTGFISLLCPNTETSLRALGWKYMSIDDKLCLEDFYDVGWDEVKYLMEIFKDEINKEITIVDAQGIATQFDYGSGTWGEIDGNVHDQKDVQAKVIYSVEEPQNVYDNDIWVNESEGGGVGTLDYNNLYNKPSIGGVELANNKSLADLDLYSREEVNDKIATESAHYIGNPNDPEGRWNNIAELEAFTAAHPELVSNNDYAIVMQIVAGSEVVIYGRWKYNTVAWVKEYDFTGDISALTAQVKSNTEQINNNIYKKYTISADKTKTTYNAREIDQKIEGVQTGNYLGNYSGTAAEIANANAFIKQKLAEAGKTASKNDYVYINETDKYVYYKYRYNGSIWEFIIAVDLSTSVTIDMVYPIGSIYMTTADINPSILFSGTIWERLDEDTYLVNGTYTGTTIGSNTKTLTKEQIPTHQHNFSWSGSHSHDLLSSNNWSQVCAGYGVRGPGQGVCGPNNNNEQTGWYERDGYGHQLVRDSDVSISGTTTNAGSGQAFNVQPKSLQVFMWKRVY